jgi:hypothetical protein
MIQQGRHVRDSELGSGVAGNDAPRIAKLLNTLEGRCRQYLRRELCRDCPHCWAMVVFTGRELLLFSYVRRIDLITKAHHQSAIYGLGTRCEVPCSMTIA